MSDRASRTTDFISMNELLNITPPDASTKEKIETANEQKKLIRKEEFNAPVVFEEGSKEGDQDQEAIDDFNFARKTLHETITKAQEVLNASIEAGAMVPDPAYFQASNNTLKILSDMSNKMIELHRQRKEIQETKKEEPKGNVTNHFYMQGTTADLLNDTNGDYIEGEYTEHDSKEK